MRFHPGDRVRFLNESGEGIVISLLKKGEVQLETDGIIIPYPESGLTLLPKESDFEKLGRKATDSRKDKLVASQGTAKKQKKSPERSLDTSCKKVIDLHYEKIAKKMRSGSNLDHLELQMMEFKRELKLAREVGSASMVFIHGVGNGRLRDEIWLYLKKQGETVRYGEADSNLYGHGATQVWIREM